MSFKFKKTEEPVRLDKQETVSLKEFLMKPNNLVIRNWVIIGLFFLLFFIFCFALQPPTHGFYWW